MKTSTPILPTLAVLLTGWLITNPTPSRATVYMWNVATPGVNNWNVTPNWLPVTGNPGAADTAVFGLVGNSPDALTVNNVVSANTALTALSYTNTGTGVWNVTDIPVGVTLSVSGTTTIGGLSSASIANLGTFVALTDAGTLQLNGNLTMGDAGSSLSSSTVDFSGLSNFVYNAAAGTIALGNATHSVVTWKLAAVSNSVTAGTINDNTPNNSNTGTGNVTLGAGTNIFNIGTFNIAAGRGSSTLAFPAGSAGGGLRIRGTGGTDANLANLTLGNHNTGGSGSTSAGTLSLNGYPVDLRLGTLSLGLSSSAPTGNSFGNGTVSFDTGSVFASNIVMAVSSGTTTFAQANGTINVGANAKLTVGTGGLSLVNQSAASGTAVGALNINGGTVVCSNSIIKTSASGTGTITLNQGALSMVAGLIGTATVPIDTFTLGDSALTLAVSATVTNANVTTLNTTSSTNNIINITSLPVITSYPVQYSIVRYANYSPVLGADFLLGSMPAGSPAYQGFISNNAANSTLDVVITSGPAPVIQVLTWNGALNSGAWDTTTANWQGALIYHPGDYVTFDDSASGSTSVNLTTVLAPGQLTISNLTKNYTFNGSGSITGAVALVKSGSAQLTLANTGANTLTGGITINGGKLQVGLANVLPTNSIVTLANDPTAGLDLNNFNQSLGSLNGGGTTGGNVTLGTGNLTVAVGGTYGGVISGTGSLIKTNLAVGGTLTLTNANTYSGGTIIGGMTNNTTLVVANPTGSGTGSGFVQVLTNGSLYIGNGGPGGSVAAFAITNNGVVRLNRSDDFTLTNLIVGTGSLQIQNTNTVTIAGANSFTGGTSLNQGTLRISHPNALGSGTIVVANGSPGVLQLTNGITVTNALVMQAKPTTSGYVPNIENLDGSNVLTGSIQLTQNGSIGWGVYATAGRLLISGSVIPVNPTNTSQTSTHSIWLSGAAGTGEWKGSIVDSVNSITNVSLRKDGLSTWILSGTNTYTGGTVISNGTLLVNGTLPNAGSVIVAGGALGGNGVIAGPVLVNSGGTLMPGNAAIGTLTLNNNLTLSGTTIMEVSHASGDKVAGIGSLTLGGTLQVLVNGTLSGGEVFKLFAATNYSGDFTTYNLPVLPSPLGWDASSVPVDGTLKVTGGTPAPPTLGFTQAGNILNFTWSGAFKLQSQTNALNRGLNTNWFDYPGGASSGVSVPITPANPTVFFRLSQ